MPQQHHLSELVGTFSWTCVCSPLSLDGFDAVGNEWLSRQDKRWILFLTPWIFLFALKWTPARNQWYLYILDLVLSLIFTEAASILSIRRTKWPSQVWCNLIMVLKCPFQKRRIMPRKRGERRLTVLKRNVSMQWWWIREASHVYAYEKPFTIFATIYKENPFSFMIAGTALVLVLHHHLSRNCYHLKRHHPFQSSLHQHVLSDRPLPLLHRMKRPWQGWEAPFSAPW